MVAVLNPKELELPGLKKEIYSLIRLFLDYNLDEASQIILNN